MNHIFTHMYGILLFSLFSFSTESAQVSVQKINTDQYNITFTLAIDGEHYIHADSIHCSINNPHFTITDQWQTDATPLNYFDEHFKETKKAFNQNVTGAVKITGTTNAYNYDTTLHCSYYTTKNNNFTSQIIPLTDFIKALSNKNTEPIIQMTQSEPISPVTQTQETTCSPALCTQTEKTWSEKISKLMTTTQSLWIQILLALLLGILMSLTPCIYPMIPITIGILQAQGSKTSFVRNFLLALSYTTGIASTFAILGLLAAFSGKLFGSLLMNPIVITIMCIILLYFGLSMLGLYEMYIPRFLQTSNTQKGSGSFVSAFLFGAISGTVASPCLSPGLILLLSIVTTLNNILLGFTLLFAFGVGTAVPLLIIGSFSGAINVLPRAGMWMVEVKRFFGIIMIGMCFYFLQNIMPLYLLCYMMAASSCALGIFYFSLIKQYDTTTIRTIKNIIGTTLIASTVLLLAKGYQATYLNKNKHAAWETCYFKSMEKAHKEQKLLFIDVGAPCCSICHAIDKKLLQETTVLQTLTKSFVSVKIDGSDDNPSACTVNKTYQVQGFPTILVIDPATQTILKKWGGELYKYTIEEFITELNAIAAHK